MEWKRPIFKENETSVQIPERWVYLRYYEAFNLLFRIENALRVFVYLVLKEEFGDKWIDVDITADESGPGTIASIAKRRLTQSQSFGYLGHVVTCPIMHLTSGELTRLVVHDSYWKLFNDHFRGSKEIIKNKLEEIGAIRNSLAHFRPIKEDDVTALKHNAQHVLMGVEEYLNHAFRQYDTVPTNTESAWYQKLRTSRNEFCTFTFRQSADLAWIRVVLSYSCPIISSNPMFESLVFYKLLNINSAAVLHQFPDIRSAVSYLSESIPFTQKVENQDPEFQKDIAIVFSAKTLRERIDGIYDSLLRLLKVIAEESELIQQDNLARGSLVYVAPASANRQNTRNGHLWTVDINSLWNLVSQDDPPEYWGSFGTFVAQDFIAGTHEYPWTPESVSNSESPFQ